MSAATTGLFALEAEIYATLTQERQNGRLTGFAVIGRTWLNEVDVFPSIGITYEGFTYAPYASSYDFKYTHKFNFYLAAQSTVSFDAAKQQADSLLDDGNGNGLIPVLTDPQYHTWNGNAARSQITAADPFSNLGDNKRANQFVAYWRVTMEAVGYLQQSGMYK